MKVAVVGGRHFDDYRKMNYHLRGLAEVIKIESIVSGGARGADSLAYKWACDYGVNFICYPPLDYEKRVVGFTTAAKMRNERIVSDADYLVAFPDPESKGTWDTVNRAKLKGIPVKVVSPDHDLEGGE